MDKKKPPPGATLISRLREGRLKREQELADRKGKGGGADSAVSAQSQPPPVETKPPEPKATGAKAEVKPETPPPPPVKPRAWLRQAWREHGTQVIAGVVGVLLLLLALRVFRARVTGFLKRLLPRHLPSLNP